MNRYGYPIVVMVVSGLLLRLLYTFVPNAELITIIRACCFFAFGLSLFNRKRSNGWVKKLFIAFLFIFFVLWECGYIVLPQIKSFFDFVGITGIVIYMFYIFCGYTFFD